jgi:hypothetical protein
MKRRSITRRKVRRLPKIRRKLTASEKLAYRRGRIIGYLQAKGKRRKR